MMMMIARGHQRMINQCGLFLCTTHIIGKIHQASRWWSIVTILFKLTHTQIITRWLLTVTRRVSPVVRVMLQQSRIFGNWHMAIPNQEYFAMQYYYTIWYLTNQPTDFTHFTRCILDVKICMCFVWSYLVVQLLACIQLYWVRIDIWL